MQNAEISKAQFSAYVSVQTSGHFNMIDPRARALANEISDCSLSKEDWLAIMENYNDLTEQYKLSKAVSSESEGGIIEVDLKDITGDLLVTNDDYFDFDGNDCLVVDPCYFFKEGSKNKVIFNLWGRFCDAMFEEGTNLFLKNEGRTIYDKLFAEKCGLPIKGKQGYYDKDGTLSNQQELRYTDLPSKYQFDNTGLCEFTYGKKKDKSITFLYSGTSYGDGSYTVKNVNKNFGVDAGMYCVVTLEDLKRFLNAKDYKDILTSGVIVEGVGDVTFDGKGNCEGDVEVCTDNSDMTCCYGCNEDFETGEGSWNDNNYCSDSCEEQSRMKQCKECNNEYIEDEGCYDDDDYCTDGCYEESNNDNDE